MIPKYRHVAETEVFVSSSLRDVVAGSSLEFHDHGLHRLKGIENEWRLHSLVSVEGKRCPEPLDRVIAEPDEAERIVREHLPQGPFSLVMIGAGVRMSAEYTPLFERLINVLVATTPGIRFCLMTFCIIFVPRPPK